MKIERLEINLIEAIAEYLAHGGTVERALGLVREAAGQGNHAHKGQELGARRDDTQDGDHVSPSVAGRVLGSMAKRLDRARIRQRAAHGAMARAAHATVQTHGWIADELTSRGQRVTELKICEIEEAVQGQAHAMVRTGKIGIALRMILDEVKRSAAHVDTRAKWIDILPAEKVKEISAIAQNKLVIEHREIDARHYIASAHLS